MHSETFLLGSPATPIPSSAVQNYSPRTLLMHPAAWLSTRPTIPSRSRGGRGLAGATRRLVLPLFSKLPGFQTSPSLHQRTLFVDFGFYSYSIKLGSRLNDQHTSSLLSFMDDTSDLMFVIFLPYSHRTERVFPCILVVLVLPLHYYSDERVLFALGHVSAFRSGREHAYSCLSSLLNISLLFLTFFSFPFPLFSSLCPPLYIPDLI